MKKNTLPPMAVKHILAFLFLSSLLLPTIGQEKTEGKFAAFTEDSYTVRAPDHWKLKKISESQMLFIGPKVGKAHAAFYITKVPKGDKGYLMAAENTKTQQSAYQNYTVTEEKDLSRQSVNPNVASISIKLNWVINKLQLPRA